MPAFLGGPGSDGVAAVKARPQADPGGVCLDGSPRRPRPSPQKGRVEGPEKPGGALPGAKREGCPVRAARRSTGRSMQWGRSPALPSRGAGSRAAGTGGGRSMADAMERRGPARRKAGGCAAVFDCARQGARPAALARRRVRDRRARPRTSPGRPRTRPSRDSAGAKGWSQDATLLPVSALCGEDFPLTLHDIAAHLSDLRVSYSTLYGLFTRSRDSIPSQRRGQTLYFPKRAVELFRSLLRRSRARRRSRRFQPPPPHQLNLTQLAAELGCCHQTARRYVEDLKIATVRQGCQVLVPKEVVPRLRAFQVLRGREFRAQRRVDARTSQRRGL